MTLLTAQQEAREKFRMLVPEAGHTVPTEDVLNEIDSLLASFLDEIEKEVVPTGVEITGSNFEGQMYQYQSGWNACHTTIKQAFTRLREGSI